LGPDGPPPGACLVAKNGETVTQGCV